MKLFSWLSSLFTTRETEQAAESVPQPAASDYPRFVAPLSEPEEADDEYTQTVPTLEILNDERVDADEKGGFDPYDTVQIHVDRSNREEG